MYRQVNLWEDAYRIVRVHAGETAEVGFRFLIGSYIKISCHLPSYVLWENFQTLPSLISRNLKALFII